MESSKSLNFENSLTRLQEIVQQLESDEVELEKSVALYKEGRALVAHCEGLLGKAEEALREASGAVEKLPTGQADDGPLDEEEIPF